MRKRHTSIKPPISEYIPDFCRDISLQLSPATTKLSIVGAIGQPALENFHPGFNLNAKNGKYVLFQSPSENLKLMLTNSKHSSFTVQTEQKCSQKFMTSNFDKPGPDTDHPAPKLFNTSRNSLQLTNLTNAAQKPVGPQTQPSKQEVTPNKHSNISFPSAMTLVNKVFTINILHILLSLAIFRSDKLGPKLS